MNKHLINILFSVIILILILGIAELPVRTGYLNHKLANTQYEKLLWLIHHFESGKLKHNQFDIAIFGSSSTLYGFNDSISRNNNINLGVNTGSRALELFILEKFLENGNTAKHWVKEYHSLQYGYFDYYGLHPVLHYVTTPSWLIKNGQPIFQPHFIVFVFNRIKVVLQSWLLFHINNNYNANYTQFGYRPKNKIVGADRYKNAIQSATFNPSQNYRNKGQWNNWLHNYETVELFRKSFDEQIKNKKGQTVDYLFQPSLIDRINNHQELNKVIKKLGKDFHIQTLPSEIDSTFYYNPLYWADEGHYSNEGAIIFTLQAEKVITQLQ